MMGSLSSKLAATYFGIAVPVLWWKLGAKYSEVPKEKEKPKFRPDGSLTVNNPFVNETWQLGFFSRLASAAFGSVLVPVRVVGIAALVCNCLFWGKLAMTGLKKDSTEPLAAWRLWLRMPIQLSVRLFFLCMGYWRIRVKGSMSKEARLIVANHTGFLDPAYLVAASGGMPVSRLENADIPLFGTLLRSFQPIMVDRSDVNSRKAVAAEMRRRAEDKAYPPIVIFPEGTCTNQRAVVSFKLGAFATFQPVQPVCVEFPFQELPGGVDPCFVNAGPSLGQLILRLLCQPWNNLRLHSSVLSKEAGGTALRDVRRIVDVDVKTAKQYLHAFASIDADGGGKIDLRQFATGLGFEPSEPVPQQVSELFHLFDADDSGMLDFREFLIGLALMNERGKGKTEDALRLAFKAFEDPETHSIEQPAFRRILRRVLTSLTEERLGELFEEADAGRTGRISCEEFVAFAMADERKEFLPLFREAYFGHVEGLDKDKDKED